MDDDDPEAPRKSVMSRNRRSTPVEEDFALIGAVRIDPAQHFHQASTCRHHSRRLWRGISPASTLRLTLLSACTPAKCLLMSRISRKGIHSCAPCCKEVPRHRVGRSHPDAGPGVSLIWFLLVIAAADENLLPVALCRSPSGA